MNHGDTEAQRKQLNDLTGKVIALCIDGKPLGLLINFNVPTLRQGVQRAACGDLFKEETGGRGFAFRLLSLLCASVSLWFK